MHRKEILVDLEYLGSINYYRLLLEYNKIWIEKHENFVKSSYRNRCYIASPNGELMLSIPVKGGKHHRQLYSKTLIDYASLNWQKLHWYSFSAAYRRSPFFEFYEDEFHPFYHQHFNNLFDFNLALFQLTLKLLDLNLNIEQTEIYTKVPAETIDDYRMKIMPNKPILNDFAVKPYQQVFTEKTGFLPHLSIVDLLFNNGPEAKSILLAK